MAPILPHYLPQVATTHHQAQGSVSGFLGQYRNRIDEKGRVSLPKPFREAAGSEPLVLLQWQRPSLSLLPHAVWAEVTQRLLEFRRSGAEASANILRISANATEIVPDKQGRILIPQWLQDAASLDGDVLMVGALDRVALWDPKAFEAAVPSEGSADFDRFAHQIFG
jgi:MraZ protein